MDCVRRVMQGEADMSILPGSYLNINPDLRIIAYSKDPQDARGWSKFVGETLQIYLFHSCLIFFNCSFFVHTISLLYNEPQT